MPDPKPPVPDPKTPSVPPPPDAPPQEGDAPEGEAEVSPNMTLQEIKDAGLQVDLPYESGEADPKPLKYADLGPDKKYTGSSDPVIPKSQQSWNEA